MWKWVIGVTRGASWNLLPDSPSFETQAEATAWAAAYLSQNTGILKVGLEGLTARRLSFNADTP
jgi:hypothetical protein